MPENHSAEWLRGSIAAVKAMDCDYMYRESVAIRYRTLLAEAEAREASVPTEADLAVADELDMLSAHIQEYIGPDDARDDIRRICYNRAKDLRRGVKRGPTAAEVIAVAGRALGRIAWFLDAGVQESCMAPRCCSVCGRVQVEGKPEHWKSCNAVEIKAAIALIAKLKEAQSGK